MAEVISLRDGSKVDISDLSDAELEELVALDEQVKVAPPAAFRTAAGRVAEGKQKVSKPSLLDKAGQVAGGIAGMTPWLAATAGLPLPAFNIAERAPQALKGKTEASMLEKALSVVGKGVGGVLPLLTDVQRNVATAGGAVRQALSGDTAKAKQTISNLPGFKDSTDFQGLGWQPDTAGERILDVAGQTMAGPGMANLARKAAVKAGMIAPQMAPTVMDLLKDVGVAGAAGGAGQLANEATGTGWAGLPASLVTAMLGRRVSSGITSNIRDFSQAALKENTPKQLRTAAANAKTMQAEGFPVNWPQLIPGGRTELTSISEDLSRSAFTPEYRANLNKQPTALQDLANRFNAQMPGEFDMPQGVANRGEAAATKVIAGKGKEAATAFRSAKERANQEALSSLEDAMMQAKAQLDETKLQKPRAETVLTTHQKAGKGQGMERTSLSFPRRNVGLDDGGASRMSPLRGRVPKGIPMDDPRTVTTVRSEVPDPADIARHDEAMSQASQAYRRTQDAVHNFGLVDGGTYATLKDTFRGLQFQLKSDSTLRNKVASFEADFDNAQTVDDLDTLLKRIDGELQGPDLGLGGNKKRLEGIENYLIVRLKQARDNLVPGYQAGADASRPLYQEMTDLKRSVVGRVATPDGMQPDLEAARKTMFDLLEAGTPPQVGKGKSEIYKLATEMNKVDPDATADWAKTHINQVLTKVFGGIGLARPNPQAGRALTEAFGSITNRGNDAKGEGIKELLSAVAEGKQLTPTSKGRMLAGFDRLREMANAASRSPEPQISMSELGQQLRDPGPLSLIRLMISFGWALQPFAKDILYRNTYRQLDKHLSNPDMVEDFIRLGQTPRLTNKQYAAVIALLAAPSQKDPPPELPVDPEAGTEADLTPAEPTY